MKTLKSNIQFNEMLVSKDTRAYGLPDNILGASAKAGASLCIETQPRPPACSQACFREIPLYCLCGAEIGSEHWDDCPYPMFGNDKIEMDRWHDAARERNGKK